MRPVTLNPNNVMAALKEIESASHDADVVEIAQNFTFSGTVVQTLRLNTTTPTIANTNAVLATLIQILQKGGLNRTT